MNKSFIHFPNGFLPVILLLSFWLASCAGLPGLPAAEEPVAGQFGPDYSPQEQQARTLDAIWSLIERNYIYYEDADVNWDDLQERYAQRVQSELSAEEFSELIQELESDLPAGSLAWQSRTERIEADLSTASATYEGIGTVIAFEAENVPHVIILSVIGGSPAEKAGLQAHDSILSIDGEAVRLDEGSNVGERIRGPAGSNITLEVQSPGQSKRSITITRAELSGRSELQANQVIIGGAYYGYLLFPPVVYDDLLDDLLLNMQALTTNRRLEGLIIDLRVAGSSAGWPLEEMLTMFQDGDVGEFYNRNESQSFSINGQDIYGSQSVPLVLLVGQQTSGFPEILAASLQESKRAIIVGEPTPGSIETASSFYLPDGSQVYVQSTSFRLPNGEEPGQGGITPNVLVNAGWDEVAEDDDPVLDAALEALEAGQ